MTIELASANGRRWRIVERDAIVRVDEAAAREMFGAVLRGPDGDASLRELASALGVRENNSTETILDALVAAIVHEEIVLVEDERAPYRGMAPVGPDGPRTDPWARAIPLSDLLPTEPVERQPTLMRLELGALGYADRCVLSLPRAGAGQWHPWAALVTVAKHLHDNPGDTLVAVGHRDAAEPEPHGRVRAEALVRLVGGDRDGWVAIAAKWGRVRDTQEYLGYLRHARGWSLPSVPVTDVADDATASGVLAFQQACNTRAECTGAIFEDGVIGEQTLGAIFDTARAELRQWLGMHRLDCDEFVWHDTSRAAIDAGTGFKPHRTMPALPVQHRGRFVDLVVVPATERSKVALGRTPMGAGVYDVAEIRTLALGRVTPPRLGMSLEIVLRDSDGLALPDTAYEIEVPGGVVVRGRVDALGEARLDDLVEGWCRVRFPELPNGCDVHDVATLAPA